MRRVRRAFGACFSRRPSAFGATLLHERGVAEQGLGLGQNQIAGGANKCPQRAAWRFIKFWV